MKGPGIGHAAILTLIVGLLVGASATYIAAPSLAPAHTITGQGSPSTTTQMLTQSSTIFSTVTQPGTTILQTATTTATATLLQTTIQQTTTTTTLTLLAPSAATFVLSVDKGSSNPYVATDQTSRVRFSGSDAGLVLQQAVDATSQLGGGTVVISVGRYNTSAAVNLDSNVALSGSVQGPFDSNGSPNGPISKDIAPEFLITNTANPFITMNTNTAVQDLLFFYPGQVKPSASAPNVYPSTIYIAPSAGTKVSGCTFVNSYDAIKVAAGRVFLENLQVGAYHIGISVDHAYDFVHIDHVSASVFWDTFFGINIPNQPIDSWVESHGVGLAIYRADGPTISDYTAFSIGTGVLLANSPDTTLQYRSSYGVASNLDMEGVTYGINVTSVRYPGWTFTNLQVGCITYCVSIRASTTPDGQFWYNATAKILLYVKGGYFWYPDSECPVCAHTISPVSISGYFIVKIQDVTAYNPVGPLAAPLIPTSGNSIGNLFPVRARVTVNGGSISAILIDGVNTHATSGTFELDPGETIGLIYTVAPTWVWTGM